MLEIQNLAYQFNDQPVFSDVSFSLQPGQCAHLKGINGAGKSTLLKIIAGLLSPSMGSVSWQGAPIQYQLYDYHAQLAYLGHRIAVKPLLSVAEQAGYENIKKHKDMRLHDLAHVMGAALSAGQKQRLALVKVLSKQAKLWILDEPLTSLDSQGIDTFTNIVEQHCASLGMVLFSSHSHLQLLKTPLVNVRLGNEVSV